MKARRLVDAEGVNPLHDKQAARLARKRGEKYDEPEYLTYKAGEIVDDRRAWILCMGDKPVAVPEDDECRAKVAKFKNSPRRKKFVAGLLRFHQNPQLVEQLGKEGQKYIRAMLEAYQSDLNELVDKPANPFADDETDEPDEV
jgi:hypothetical protein